jgi:hypothetical protein
MKPHRILLTGASGTLGRKFLELSGNDPNLEILVLIAIMAISAAIALVALAAGIGHVFMATGGAAMHLNNIFRMGILDREGSLQSGIGLRNRAIK